MNIKEINILGVDPGLANTGFGIIRLVNNEFVLLEYGCIYTSPSTPFAQRLKEIYQDLSSVIQKFKPAYISVEDLFFCKNVKSAMSVGHARGVVLLCAANHDSIVYECNPLQIKQSVVGYGGSSKEQVQKMVRLILKMDEIPNPSHSADALAAAICCVNDCLKTY